MTKLEKQKFVSTVGKYKTYLCQLLGLDYKTYNYAERTEFKPWNSYNEEINTEVLRLFNEFDLKFRTASQISKKLTRKSIYLGTIGVQRYMDHNELVPNTLQNKKKARYKKPVDTTVSENYVTSFNDKEVGELWCIDASEFPFRGGKFNLISIQDISTREIIGLEILERAFTGADVKKLYNKTIKKVGITPTIIHADNGTEGKNKLIKKWAIKEHVTLSYSSPRRPTDNPVIESTYKIAKNDLIPSLKIMNKDEANEALNWYFIDYFNNERIHGYKDLTPCEHREQMLAI